MTDKHTPGPWLRIDGPDYAEIHAAFRPSSPAVALVGKAEDADLIASAPDMATRITALEAEKAELVEASNTLARYTTHNLGCAIYQSSYTIIFPDCSCGLEAATTLAKHQEGEG